MPPSKSGVSRRMLATLLRFLLFNLVAKASPERRLWLSAAVSV